MMYPWEGDAKPVEISAWHFAVAVLGCEAAAIGAVWDVESTGKEFQSDGSLTRRFEPHHMPGAKTTWRDSLAVTASRREAMLQEAYAQAPAAALNATSWGGPQIMGFNHAKAGFSSAQAMVEAMADDGTKQVEAFVNLVKAWGLDSALRAQDWEAFARRYNGPGQAAEYAARIEKAYRKRTGRPSVEVLRQGSTGPKVAALQVALGIPADGLFGTKTEAAVREYQTESGIAVDGVVGARTWAMLEAREQVKPPTKSTLERIDADAALELAKKVGGAVAVLEGVRRVIPDQPYEVLTYGIVAGLIIYAAVTAWQAARA